MLLNYFKTAGRNLLKNPFYALINITGVNAGLLAGILILLWVHREPGFDAFHTNPSNIYHLENLARTRSNKQIRQNAEAPIGTAVRHELVKGKQNVRLLSTLVYFQLKYRDKAFNEEHSAFTDPSLFSVSDFNNIKGNNKTHFPMTIQS